MWNKFWNWYENKILGSIVIIAIIQFIQVPHMVWNADIMLEAGMISRVHPIIDWFLYGVDLIEIISIVNVGMIMFSLVKKDEKKKNKIKLTNLFHSKLLFEGKGFQFQIYQVHV